MTRRRSGSDVSLVLRIQRAYPQIYYACHVAHAPKGAHGDRLSDRDQRILGHLDRTRPLGQGELAEHLALAPSTLSEAVGSLEARGLLARRPGSDRRRRGLVLTDEGGRSLGESSILDGDRLGALLEELEPGAREAAVAGLDLLAEASKRLLARESQGRGREDEGS